MSALAQASEHLLALHAEVAARAGDTLAPLREAGREQFAARGLPHGKLEDWRYTSLTGLARRRFAPAQRGAVDRQALEAAAAPVFACSLHVFVDGSYDPELSALGSGGDVRVESLASTAAPELGALVDGKAHPLAALNSALLEDGALVRVPRGVQVDDPLHVVFVSTGAGQVRAPRLLVVAEPGSRVAVIQDHVCIGGADGLTTAVAELYVGEGAEVACVTLQREGEGNHVFTNLAARVERDARLHTAALSFEGALVRNDLAVTLAGEGAEATLDGLYVGSGERVVDNHTLVDHAVPHCTSRELYKGVLGGRSRGVFRGRVCVRPDAQKTRAEQSNPNLLLARTAEIDTKPQLEIHADDVRCSHGAAIGQLSEEALFYLQARAIDAAQAKRMLTRGFAREVLDALPVEALREGLEATLDASLAAAEETA